MRWVVGSKARRIASFEEYDDVMLYFTHVLDHFDPAGVAQGEYYIDDMENEDGS